MPNPLKSLLKFKVKLKSKSKSKIRTPAEMVHRIRELLIHLNDSSSNVDHAQKWTEKVSSFCYYFQFLFEHFYIIWFFIGKLFCEWGSFF